MENHPLKFYPSVFDPLDCQLAKLCMFNLCFEPLTTKPSGMYAIYRDIYGGQALKLVVYVCNWVL